MILTDFHFLYPLWFLLLPLLLLLLRWLYQTSTSGTQWHDFIDEKLRPYILTTGSEKKNNRFVISVAIAGIIAIIALAGPSWDKRSVPAFQAQQGLVVAMDLSTSMIIDDITPSRLVRSRFKLIDLLKLRKEGQTGLVVFAGAAFAVSPLTDDSNNITEQMIRLSPSIMPVQGSRLYLAIDEASKLLEQSGFKKGNILLMTDGLAELDKAIESAKKAKKKGYSISILGIGTRKGGTIPLAGGRVYTRTDGSPIIASLNEVALQQVVKAGGGSYQLSVLADDDIRYFNEKFSIKANNKLNNGIDEKNKREVEYWNNAGIYLSLLLIPLMLLLFRRGVLFSIGLAFLVLPQPEAAHAYEWDALWKNDNQRGQIALENKQADKAVSLFKRPDWQAAAAYRNKNYQKADQLYSQFNTAESDYNRGNALARQGKYPQAIAAYEQALTKNKELQDAKDNKALVEQLKQQQDKEQQQQDKQNKQDKQNDQQDQSKQKNKEQNQRKNKNGKDSDQMEDTSEQKDKDTSDKESQQDKQQQQSDKEKQADKDKKDDAEGVSDPKQHGRQGKESEQSKQQKKAEQQSKEEVRELREKNQRTNQWLRKIPDDSAGLWRRKFMYQYRRSSNDARGRGEQQPW
jgi:Ca-activated chloride channel family protein